MKEVLTSIKPEWCELIASGMKSIEVRKTRPKCDEPFKVYIYCTLQGSNEFFQSLKNQLGEYEALSKWNRENWGIRKGKVIGEFICDKIYEIGYDYFYPCGYEVSMGEISRKELYEKSCLSFNQMDDYLNMELGYGWHISDLKIYDKPKELDDFLIYGKSACNQKNCKNCWYIDNYGICDLKDVGQPLFRPPQSWCYVEGLL